MKVLVILFLAALVSAEIDWANVKPVMDLDGFWDGRDPDLARAYHAAKAKRARSGRIVNGNEAERNQFPYQVRGLKRWNFQCLSYFCYKNLRLPYW